MIPYQAAVTINRPVDQVFRYAADFGNMSQWMKGIVESRALSEGPVGAGTRYHQIVKLGPWKFEAGFHITEYEENRKVSWKPAPSSAIRYEGSMMFEPVDSSTTRLVTGGKIGLPGPLRFIEPLMGGEVRKEEQAELDRMKSIIEGNV